MFRKIELWVLLLVLLLGLLATLVFGMLVHRIDRGSRIAGPLTPAIQTMVSAPDLLRKAWRDAIDPGRDFRARENRFGDESGFHFGYAPGTRPDSPFLLLNRFDAARVRSVSELVDLNRQETVARWVYDVDPIWEKSRFDRSVFDLSRDFNSTRFAGIHAFLTEEGDIIVNGMSTPLLRFGPCGDLLWEQPEVAFHHAIERDEEGTFWVPGHDSADNGKIGSEPVMRDLVMRVAGDGTILYRKAVAAILLENGLGHLIWGNGPLQPDPLHLNDIEPVRSDGPHWRKGDVFLSLRNRSLVLLYRPQTGKILWQRSGDDAWWHQHDVSIIDDHRIAVFDNRSRAIMSGLLASERSRLVIVDLDDDSARSLYPEAFESLDLHTHQQGRGLVLPDGRAMVEETESGRLVVFDAAGKVDWSYINRGPDGTLYLLNWSRLVPRDIAEKALAARAARCPGATP